MCLKDSHASYLGCNIGKTTPALCSKACPNYCVYFHFEPFREEGKSLEVDLKINLENYYNLQVNFLKKKKLLLAGVMTHSFNPSSQADSLGI